MFLTTTSCEDILETESEQIVFDPALDQKTDSMFYTLAILKSVQLAIDQNVLINEMRGDLTETNMYTQTDLRELANFSATAANKYDSAYVYYRIINNCNYYIAHRDTMLMTGSTKVAIPEYRGSCRKGMGIHAAVQALWHGRLLYHSYHEHLRGQRAKGEEGHGGHRQRSVARAGSVQAD